MRRILVIEDHEALARGLRSNLAFEGHVVEVAESAGAGLARAMAGDFDLIILDLMLPDGDGYRVLRELRESGRNTVVLILSALGEEADKVRGFRFGADDYVTKPFGLLELMARVEALLRRTRTAPTPAPVAVATRVRCGDLVIDLSERQVWRRGRQVELRPREFDLLATLVRRRGELMTRAELLQAVWGYDASVVSRTVDTHIAELRRKLEVDPATPRHIITVLKGGYRFTE